MIKEIISDNELFDSVNVITQSFRTVADEFNLTKNNCPTHPSFITHDNLLELKNKGLLFFGLFINNTQIGFIAIEKANDDLFYIEKLSILPQHRHKSYGKKLLAFAVDYIKKLNGKMISIGIINDHIVLKKWYNTIGFNEIMTKEYDHLPFTVCLMEKIL